MDGLSSFAARFSAGNRSRQRTSQRLLRFRTWSSRPHAIGCHRPAHPPPHARPSTSWVRPFAILPAALQNMKMSASSKQFDRTMRNGPSTANHRSILVLRRYSSHHEDKSVNDEFSEVCSLRTRHNRSGNTVWEPAPVCGSCMQRECAETEAFLVGLVQGNPLSDLLISKRYILSNT